MQLYGWNSWFLLIFTTTQVVSCEKEKSPVNTKRQRSKAYFVARGFCSVLALAAICVAQSEARQKQTQKQAVDAQGAPIFRVDPFWPQPLPNRWSMQQVTGLYVEQKNNHAWF